MMPFVADAESKRVPATWAISNPLSPIELAICWTIALNIAPSRPCPAVLLFLGAGSRCRTVPQLFSGFRVNQFGFRRNPGIALDELVAGAVLVDFYIEYGIRAENPIEFFKADLMDVVRIIHTVLLEGFGHCGNREHVIA